METYANALGPKALQWLKARYQWGDLPTALGNMMSVWNGVISSSAVVADINAASSRSTRAPSVYASQTSSCAHFCS